MSYFKKKLLLIPIGLLGLVSHPAQAIIPVTDIGAIMQLITQIEYWKQQIQGMSDQLSQLKSSYDAMTGNRGMQNLLAMSPQMRNYLPADWNALANALQGLSNANSSLSGQVQSLVGTNAVLTASQLNDVPSEVRASLETERRAAALRQVTTRSALANTSGRFQAIQQLINAIPAATDPKAIFDLQARIQAELGMLQNEQTKLVVLQQVSDAEERAQRQRDWEIAVEGQGRFDTRFRPQP